MEQNKENTSSVSRTLKEYFIITVAVLIMDIGIYVFKFPNNFSFGGVSGMAVVFAKFLPFTASVINLVINLVLLVVGFAFLGRNFGLKTAYVTVLSSVLLNVFEHLFPMSGPLTDQISLELCFAILLPGNRSCPALFRERLRRRDRHHRHDHQKVLHDEHFHRFAALRPAHCSYGILRF